MKVCSVVVTYNRIELLKENISGLLNQIDHDIIIVDNDSTDGTDKYINSLNENRIIYINTGKNIGGAGGFSRGIKYAIEHNYDFAWVMDDDSVPQKDSLSSLLNKAKDIDYKFSFLASLVYWTDGSIFPMNAPNCNYKHVSDMKYDMIRNYKLVPIKNASFVGCFINLADARMTHLPIKEFFIYGDDIEYTTRLRKIDLAYLDLDSIIIHKAPTQKGADIVIADIDRLPRYIYQWRNAFYTHRENREVHLFFSKMCRTIARIIIKSESHKIMRIRYLLLGSFKGIFFNPPKEMVTR